MDRVEAGIWAGALRGEDAVLDGRGGLLGDVDFCM